MEPSGRDLRLNRALERLAVPRAPETVVPRVMRAGPAKQQAPWFRRDWRSWPVAWQVVSMAAGLALILAALTVEPTSVSVGVEGLAPARAVTNQVEPAIAALQILWRVVIEPLVPMLFVLASVMVAVCVVLGLMLAYVVLGRTWQR